MKITEKREWVIVRTVVELTTFDRFVIAQAAADLQNQCDAQSPDGPMVVPFELYEKVIVLLTKLAGNELCKNAESDVFAPDKFEQKPQPKMPEQELQKMDV